MIYETVLLREDHPDVTFTVMCVSDTAELKLGPRPTVIVCPGGAYTIHADKEGEPVAAQFLAAGYNAAVLKYSLNEHAVDYNPLIDAALAITYLRVNHEKYNVDPDRIFILGFSSGGHVAATAGTLWNIPEIRDAVGVTAGQVPEGINRPTGTLLCYPVISGGPRGHKTSIVRLSGHREPTDEDIRRFSMELNVDETTSPAFLWHTSADTGVPVENSLLYAAALAAHKVPFELHVFPYGKHGLALANELTRENNDSNVVPHNACWIDLAIRWVGLF